MVLFGAVSIMLNTEYSSLSREICTCVNRVPSVNNRDGMMCQLSFGLKNEK